MRRANRPVTRVSALIASGTLFAALFVAVVVTAAPVSATTTPVGTESAYRAALTALSSDSSGPHTIALTADITLTGGGDPAYSGAQPLTIDGDGHTIDAAGTSRILFRNTGSSTITLTGLTLTGGTAPPGEPGGAVHSCSGVLTVIDSTVTGNTAGQGGGLSGGTGAVNLYNSTVTANTATDTGGGLLAGEVGFFHSTVVANGAPTGANMRTGTFGGFASVVADPIGGPNCFITILTDSQGYNWADDTSCSYNDGTDTQDVGANPALGNLRDNGGPTLTMQPRPDSPLVDSIPTGSCSGTITTDQRGLPRPQGDGCDTGAVEGVFPEVTITTPADGTTVFQGQTIASDYSCIVPPVGGLPLDTCVGTVALGSPIPTSTLGANSFTVTATDEGGNTVAVTHSYTVVPPTFTDVPVTHQFFLDIEWMAAEGISTGFQPGPDYRPGADVTRQAMSAFMYRLAGSPPFPDPPTATFSDVATTSQFFTEIEWMAAEDITTGFPGGTYKPGTDVTRQAMSAFMHRLADGPGVGI